MSPPRRICVVTGTRADYGLLRRLMEAVRRDPALQLQVIATGMHLSPQFGMTYRDIEEDGFDIDIKVEMLLAADSAAAVTKTMGLGLLGFADAFDRLSPDVIVILGDRFEALVAAQAAFVARVPIAHIHGGEISEGVMDEGFRHAITKMAQLHFVAAEAYRQRVVQLGEAPDRVFNVGAPGLDCLADLQLLSREELEADLGVPLAAPLLLTTYHPATLGRLPPAAAMGELLAALDRFPQATVVFTYPNADTGGRSLIEAIERYVGANPRRAAAFASLGQRRYLSLLRLADVVLGNSSSGLIEAPALKTATVNVGDRQKGRLKASSVIDTGEDRNAITDALARALSPEFQQIVSITESLYGIGGASAKILERLRTPLPPVQKTFFDIAHDY